LTFIRNAALGPKGREVMVRRVIEAGWSVTEAAAAAGVSDQTCRTWLGRFVADGPAGLIDRSSVPTSVPSRTPEDRVQVIAALRRLRFTGAQIAEVLGMPETTVCGILTRIGMGRLGRLGQEPAVRYERQRPGELIHVDVKKLGRIQGGAGHRVTGKRRYNPTTTKLGIRRGLVRWEFVHIAIDDATRLAYAEVLTDETAATAVAFPAARAAVLRQLRHHDQGAADRQWLGLSLSDPRDRLQSPRHPPPANPSAAPANQRQGGALHPHDAR